jgi:hypothetical protein
MPIAHFKYKLPDGAVPFSTEYPDEEFRILATLPAADGLLVILEAPLATTPTLGHYLDIWLPAYDVLHADEQVVVIQYALPFLPSPYRAVLVSENLLGFPLTLQNGWMRSELITSHERLSQLQAAFEAMGLTYELVSVTQSTDPADLLTDRQREFITEAVERGYYESPRECTLTDLAAAMGVTKGAASGTLHRAERRIIKSFLGKPAV